MSLFNNIRKSNLFKGTLGKIIISYIVVLLIPLLINSIVFFNVNNILINNLKSYNSSVLNQVLQSIDNQMISINKSTQFITYDENLQNIWNNYDNEYRIYKLTSLLKSIKNLDINNEIIEKIYIYFYQNDTVISSDSKGSSKNYFSYLYDHYDENDYNLWVKTILRKDYSKAFESSFMNEEKRKFNMGLNYIQLLTDKTKNYSATMVVKINEESIKSLVDNINRTNNSIIIITDHNANIMYSNTDNTSILDQAAEAKSFSTVGFNNETYYFQNIKSDLSKWEIKCFTPKDKFVSSIEWVQNLFIVMFLLCLIVGGLFSYYFARKNLSPVNEIIDIFKTDKETIIGNEYDFLKEKVKHINLEKETLKNEVDKQYPIIKNALLSQILKGQATTENIKEIDESLNNFVVLLIDIDDCSEFIELDNEYEWFLARYSIKNIIEEIFDNKYKINFVDLEKNRIAIIIASTKSILSERANFIDFIDNIIKLIREMTKIIITISISDEKYTSDDISFGYVEAMTAMENKVIQGIGSTIEYAKINRVNQYYYYPIDEEINIINNAKQGKFTEIKGILDNIYRINFVDRALSPEIAKCLLWDMMNTVIKILNTTGISFEDLGMVTVKTDASSSLEGEPLDWFDKFYNIKSLSMRFQYIIEFYNSICEFYNSKSNEHIENSINLMKEYINENYTDCSFSISQIADELNFSRQYLSDFFKKNTGGNLMTYLTNLRIEHSKNLLETTDLSVLQIANAVGYIDDAGFRKAFKKITGFTPSNYRNIYKV